MWYASKNDKKELNYSQPIIAELDTIGSKYLLIPHIKEGHYGIVGFDWLNISTGEYNSCRYFETPQEAVRSYSGSYEVYNATLQVEEV